MEDNKRKDKAIYDSLASFLDDRSATPDGNAPQPEEEELQKLVFLWDECNPPEADTEGVWEKTLRKIQSEGTPEVVRAKKRPAILPAWALVAASIALLIGFAYFFHRGEAIEDEKAKMEQLMLAATADDDVKEVTLVVSDKKKIEIANNSKVAYTPGGQVQVNSTKVDEEAVAEETTATEKKEEVAEEYNQIIVPKGRRSMIVLADNSKIWINSGSKVIYPRSFKGEKRQIYVEGEVYLKVARNEAMPFVVNTSAFEVEVLGTSFNVAAYKNAAEASIVLVEGAVDVKDCSERHVRMNPNERVELNEAGISKKEHVDASEFIYWVDGIWVLKGKPLKEVLQYLTEYYGQKVCCLPSVEDEPFYGKLFLNEELNKVLESIKQTLPEAFATREDVVYIDNSNY
ncbi:FecR family protein [Bacteroides sp. GD17]|jgi:transmembrane sensor|uniref:FecR family protein n=1 Tax=Bacteroides sp. GD17 TaxID=3139826 RepID=UPI0025EA8D8A|nr:FecR family protein [uncultured Bacteroides sp.]